MGYLSPKERQRVSRFAPVPLFQNRLSSSERSKWVGMACRRQKVAEVGRRRRRRRRRRKSRQFYTMLSLTNG